MITPLASIGAGGSHVILTVDKVELTNDIFTGGPDGTKQEK